MARLSGEVEPKITEAIGQLDILQSVKDSIDWEIVPALVPGDTPGELGFTYMLAMSLPVPAAGDHVMHVGQLDDIHAGQPEFSQAVRLLYASVQAEADDRQQQAAAHGNGSGRLSPGGLHLP